MYLPKKKKIMIRIRSSSLGTSLPNKKLFKDRNVWIQKPLDKCVCKNLLKNVLETSQFFSFFFLRTDKAIIYFNEINNLCSQIYLLKKFTVIE